MSNRTSAISHPEKQALVIIREDYLALCNGDDCAAAILNYFEHWHNGKLDAQEQWKRQCEIAEKTGEPLPQAPDIWIYASQEQIQFDMMFTYGERKIGAAIDWLIEVGFIIARNNPKHGWDRTKQYQFEVAFVQLAIREIADSNGAKMRNGSVQNRVIEGSKIAEAIPKTTTKTKSKNNNKGTPKEKPVLPDVPADVVEQYEGLISPMMTPDGEKSVAGLINTYTLAWVRDAFVVLGNKMQSNDPAKNPYGYLTAILKGWTASGKPDMPTNGNGAKHSVPADHTARDIAASKHFLGDD